MALQSFLGCIFLLVCAFVVPASGQMEGWRMTDRFSGFRFEVYGKVQNVGFSKAAQVKAESLGCFGWIQNRADGALVGEARCSKAKGPNLKEWLETGPGVAQVDKVIIKDYEDTKIKLHFSHFKILEDARITCFRDAPHQCPEFASAKERNGTAEGGGDDIPSSVSDRGPPSTAVFGQEL